jgi:hypothetical protein
MDNRSNEWGSKGATISDKTARKKYGLTEAEILDAIRAGTLQFREASVHGTPWLRLLRREVEALVWEKRGEDFLQVQRNKIELSRINAALRRLKTEMTQLQARKAELLGRK